MQNVSSTKLLIKKTRVANITIDEFDIVHLTFPEKGIEIELNDSKEILESRITLTPPSTKQLILADLRTEPKPNRAARDFAKSEEMKNSTKALALLVSSGLSTILGNFFIGFNKGDFPVKIFTNKETAISWLKSI